MKLTIIFIVIGLLGLVFFVYQHEQVHVTVYENYGIKSKVNYNFGSAVTIPNGNCNDSCRLAQSNVDNLGYHLKIFYVLIFAGFLIIICLLDLNNVT